jgi:hypothetical protein
MERRDVVGGGLLGLTAPLRHAGRGCRSGAAGADNFS